MQTLNDMWLRGLAAQHSLIHLASYSVAIASAASLQATQMSMDAPQAFWAAMARASGSQDQI